MSGTETVCPVCGARQDAGLLCASCTDTLEKHLGDVRSLVADLDITLSKQARIGTPGKGGLAREKNPIHYGALEAADTLGNVLTTWARNVAPEKTARRSHWTSPAFAASWVLLEGIDAIRRHPAVAELVDEITDAVEQARRVIDRPIDRAYLGQCWVEHPVEGGEMATCYEEIWGRPDASEVTCRTCLHVHPVAERRAWLLLQAADMLTTAKEAARYIGEVGDIKVTEASIRGLIHRRKLAYRAGTTTFRLGDLLDVLTDRAVVTSAGTAV